MESYFFKIKEILDESEKFEHKFETNLVNFSKISKFFFPLYKKEIKLFLISLKILVVVA